MLEPVIVDTSSLIALEKMDLLQILCKIYKEVVIPESVIREFGNLSLPCLSTRKVESNLLKLLITDLNLGKGEADVIALASQTGLKVVIDDSKARYNGPQNLDSVISYTWEIKGGGPSGTNAKEVSAFI